MLPVHQGRTILRGPDENVPKILELVYLVRNIYRLRNNCAQGKWSCHMRRTLRRHQRVSALGFQGSKEFHAAGPLRTTARIFRIQLLTNNSTDPCPALVAQGGQSHQQGRLRIRKRTQNLKLRPHNDSQTASEPVAKT